MAIVDLQRGIAEAGRIRIGQKVASKNGTRFFSNSTKWVASLISTLFFLGALVRSRISTSRSSGNDQVSYSPAITSVGA